MATTNTDPVGSQQENVMVEVTSQATIASLDLEQEDPVLEAKVYRKWVSKRISDKKDEDFCCILIDAEGNAIQATMDVNSKTFFDAKMDFGVVYKFSKFICDNTSPYQQTLDNKITLKFGKRTSFVRLPGKESIFPDHHFELTPFSQLSSRVPYTDPNTSKKVYPRLTDFLGCLRSISDLIPYGDAMTGQKYLRKLDIENLDGSVIVMTMWDDLAVKFNKTDIQKAAFPAIIIVTSCRVSEYRSGLQLQSTSATHYYVNIKVQEVRDAYQMFKDKYGVNPPLQVMKSRYNDVEQEKTRNRQTLATLLQQDPASFEDIRFTCEAALTGFNNNKKWNYASCKDCSKVSLLRKGSYFCVDHGKQDPVTYRFRFTAMASDGTASAEFLFFTEAGQKLMRQTCTDVLKKFVPSVPNQLPPDMVNEIGQKHIFQLEFRTSSEKGSGRFVVKDILDIPPINQQQQIGTSSAATGPKTSDEVMDTQQIVEASFENEDSENADYAAPDTPPKDVIDTIADTIVATIPRKPTSEENKEPEAMTTSAHHHRPTKRALDQQLSLEAAKKKKD